MKKLITSMMLLAASTYGAMAQNEAMNVVRNDGAEPEFFYKSDVDSIVFSKVDIDGNAHDEYVVQEIWVNNVASRIPLGAIESVTFTDDTDGHYYRRCPDNNHPHAIDLGLPSGTKWCCCNVGATSPEAYGGYYAWGETSEKSTYTEDNYAYYDSNSGEYINIGEEISGTQYDVAHVRMGGAWRMSTLAQLQELISNCTYKWTQLNGVNGQLVTGPNGGQVFFPAAGDRWYGSLDDDGSLGCYWSGSLDSGYDDSACSLGFYSGDLYWSGNYRGNGQSVRAVCP